MARLFARRYAWLTYRPINAAVTAGLHDGWYSQIGILAFQHHLALPGQPSNRPETIRQQKGGTRSFTPDRGRRVWAEGARGQKERDDKLSRVIPSSDTSDSDGSEHMRPKPYVSESHSSTTLATAYLFLSSSSRFCLNIHS